jgi:hypothetical protein
MVEEAVVDRAEANKVLRMLQLTYPEIAFNRIQEDGTCFAAGARWNGRSIMRLSVISWAMNEADAERSVAAIVKAWRDVQMQDAPKSSGRGAV